MGHHLVGKISMLKKTVKTPKKHHWKKNHYFLLILMRKEEKLAKQKEGRKKRAKKVQKKSGSNKRRGRPGPLVKLGDEAKRIKRLLKNESQKGQRSLGKENIDPQVNQVAVPSLPERVNSVQKNTFLDRRLNTEAFLTSLQENA